MTRSTRQQGMLLLAVFLAAAPFVFGFIRAFSKAHDFRLLWIAIASFAGAMVARLAGKRLSGNVSSVRQVAQLTFVTATLFAAVEAILLGATSSAGIWGIAFGFGFFWTASYALSARGG